MAASRRTTILEGMFLDIATHEDRIKVDELYERGQKGSATVLMLKRVREKWVELINSQPSPRHQVSESDGFAIPFLRLT